MTFRKTLVAAVAALAVVTGLGAHEASAAEVVKSERSPRSRASGGRYSRLGNRREEEQQEAPAQFFYSGQQGDEGAMVGKMKAGQLDGAAIAVGLSKIYKPILALQLPAPSPRGRSSRPLGDALEGDFQKGLSDANSSSSAGATSGARTFLKGGSAVSKPADIQKRKPYMWRDDEVSPKFLPGHRRRHPRPAERARGAPAAQERRHEHDQRAGARGRAAVVGPARQGLEPGDRLRDEQAIVVTSSRMKSLPGDLRAVLTDTGRIAGRAPPRNQGRGRGRVRSHDRARRDLTKFDVDEAAFKEVFEKQDRAGAGRVHSRAREEIEGIGGV